MIMKSVLGRTCTGTLILCWWTCSSPHVPPPPHPHFQTQFFKIGLYVGISLQIGIQCTKHYASINVTRVLRT